MNNPPFMLGYYKVKATLSLVITAPVKWHEVFSVVLRQCLRVEWGVWREPREVVHVRELRPHRPQVVQRQRQQCQTQTQKHFTISWSWPLSLVSSASFPTLRNFTNFSPLIATCEANARYSAMRITVFRQGRWYLKVYISIFKKWF